MYRRSLALDRDVGGPRPSASSLRWAIAALSVAVLILICPATAAADLVWEQLWNDDFEHSVDPRWTFETYGRGDKLELEREYGFDKRSNDFLAGRSPDMPGCGYKATLPSLEALGLDPMSPRYVLRFRYRLPDMNFCWTFPLISPDVSLVATECTSQGRARIAPVGESFECSRACAELTPGQWYDFRIVVNRDVFEDTRTARIFVNEQLVATHVRSGPSIWPSITFMDLPVRPIDIDEGVPPLPGSCFGSGDWDDVKIMALQPRTPDGGRIDDPDIREGDRVFPNPANPATMIQFELERDGPASVRIVDTRGRVVRNLFSGVQPAGPIALRWQGRDDAGRAVASGAYVVRLSTPDGTRVMRVTLVR